MRRSLLLATSLVTAAWAAALTFGGGLTVVLPWGRVSSRDPVRPLGVALVTAALYAFLYAETRYSQGGRFVAARWPRRIALAMALMTLGAGIRFGTFTAGGADPSGYLSQAARWSEGRVVRPVPGWVAGAPWPDAARTAMPLGYVPGPTPMTDVPSYPAGLPLLMALARRLAGEGAEYLVVPICGAVLVWATFLLGARLAHPWVGVIAASLMASSPPFLLWLVMPMSDVPVTACWTMALVCALRRSTAGALGAGTATAIAIAIRPNLVPLAAIVALLAMANQPRRVWAFLAYSTTAAAGVAAVAMINRSLYGSPFRTGYGALEALYSLDHVRPNLEKYGSWFLGTQTAAPLVGLLAPFWGATGVPRVLAGALILGWPVAVVCLYLPYMPFEDWSYLRFLLPAYPVLFAGAGIVAVEAGRRWASHAWVAPVITLTVMLLILRGLDYSNAPTDLAASEPRYRHVAARASRVSADAIFVSFQHSGSLHYYTGREVLRWDWMDREGIDQALDYLERLGHPLYWVGEPFELDMIQQRFAGSRFLARIVAGRTEITDGVRLVDLRPAS